MDTTALACHIFRIIATSHENRGMEIVGLGRIRGGMFY